MNIYLEAFGLFSKIGVFTIGGGYAMVPLIEEEIVEKRKWIAKDDFIDLLAIPNRLLAFLRLTFLFS